MERPKLSDRPFRWPVYSTMGEFNKTPRFRILAIPHLWYRFRFLPAEDRGESTWIKKSDESALRNRLIWVCGENDVVKEQVSELAKSQRMVNKYKPRRDSLSAQKKSCLNEEEVKLEEGLRKVKEKVAECWKSGAFTSVASDMKPSSKATHSQPLQIAQPYGS